MATTTETVRLEFEAKLDKFQKELGKIPDIGAKEARGLVRKMKKELQAAERAAKKMNKATRDGGKKAQAALEGAKQAAEGFQGQIGGAAGIVEKFARSMSELNAAVGPVGAALGGTALAVAGVGFVAFEAASKVISFVEGAAELVEGMDSTDEAAQAAGAEIAVFTDKLAGTRAASERLQVLLAGDLAAAFGGMLDLFTGLVLKLEPAIGGLARLSEAAEGARSAAWAVSNVLSLGVVGLVAYKTGLVDAEEAGREFNETAAATAAAAEEAAEAFEEAGPTMADFHKIQQQRAKEAAAAAEKAYQRQQAALGQLTKIQQASTMALLDDEGKLREAYRLRVAEIDRLEEVSGDAATAAVARSQEEEVLQKKLAELEAKRADARRKEAEARRQEAEQRAKDAAAFEEEMERAAAGLAELEAMDFGALIWEGFRQNMVQTVEDLNTLSQSFVAPFGEMMAMRTDAIAEEFEKKKARRDADLKQMRSAGREEIAHLLESGAIDAKEASLRRKRLQEEVRDERDKIKNMRKAHRKAALKSFKAQKAAQKAQAIIDAARAGLALIPAFTFLGPGAPAAAAGAAGAQLAVSLAKIRKQKPPQFSGGGMVGDRVGGDHRVIAARMDEAVLSPRATAAVGGAAGVNALNQGGGMGPTTIILKVGPAVIARAVLEAPGLAERVVGELRAELGQSAGLVPVHGRG